jgi:transglutaminase-like putative cysteine protease
MDRKRPQLSVDELRQLRWLLGGLLVLISVSTVGYMEIDAWLLAGLTTVAVLAALVRPDLPARVPTGVHRFAFPLIVVFFAWDFYSSAQLLPSMIHLDYLLLLYRGISYRKKRDDLQIIVLGLFLVMVAGVLTVSLEFALHILVFTAGTLAFLFVITLTEAAEAGTAVAGGVGSGPRAGGVPPAWTSVHWRRLARRVREVADWRLLALGGLLFVGVMAVSALLFLAIPRFQIDSGLFLDRFLTKQSRTGFSDSIHLGDVVDIQQDNSIALRVDASDPGRIPAVPYWRMVVLDEYRDGEFRTSLRLKAELTRSTRTSSFVRGVAASGGSSVVWTFYLESGISRFLPLGGRFARLLFREPQAVQDLEQLGIVALRNEPVGMTAYRVEGMSMDGFLPDRMFGEALRSARQAPTAPVAVPGAPGDPARPRLVYPLTTLELPGRPADVDALRRIVGQISGDNPGGAAEFAVKARRWLTERHGYSLKVDLRSGDRDPVVAWMESDLPGHCELFTAAFTLLARTAGFPTRAITGFKGGDWNAYEDYFMVRNSHAHAWCEIHDGRTGWIRVDPTDGSAPVNAGAQSVADESRALTQRSDRTWSARLDAVRILWYRRVVSFDQRTQIALVAGLKETTGRFGAAVRALMEDASAALRRWSHAPGTAWRAWCGLAGAVAVLAAGVLWWRRERGWWWRFRGWRREGLDPVRREAGRWLCKIDRSQINLDSEVEATAPRSGERQQADSASTAEFRINASAVLEDLQRLRYGASCTWPNPQAVFRRARLEVRGRPARRISW